MMNIVVILPVR